MQCDVNKFGGIKQKNNENVHVLHKCFLEQQEATEAVWGSNLWAPCDQCANCPTHAHNNLNNTPKLQQTTPALLAMTATLLLLVNLNVQAVLSADQDTKFPHANLFHL